MSTIDFPGHVVEDAERFAAAVELGPLDAPVPACPGWDLHRLTLHLGHIHRWARIAAATGVHPDPAIIEGPPEHDHDPVALADWLRTGAASLADTLGRIDPTGPTWHPFPVPLVGAVWPRRQAQETVVHRWDAESAVGTPRPVDAVLAADGIDEYLTMMLPRLLQKGRVLLASGSVHLACTDTPGSWTAASVDGELFVTGCADETEHTPAGEVTGHPVPHAGRGVAHGRAEDLLLALWGRRPISVLQIDGDADVVQRWFEMGGV